MKTSIVRVLFLWLLALPAVAGEAALAAEVNQVKQSVLELNRELYQLEQDLLSPATTRLALYLSLQGGEYFEPLALEIRSETLPPVLHIYTERQIQALKMGAVQPLASLDAGPGQHALQITLKGLDNSGQPQTLQLTPVVEKSTGPLLLELQVSDNPSQRRAQLQMQTW